MFELFDEQAKILDELFQQFLSKDMVEDCWYLKQMFLCRLNPGHINSTKLPSSLLTERKTSCLNILIFKEDKSENENYLFRLTKIPRRYAKHCRTYPRPPRFGLQNWPKQHRSQSRPRRQLARVQSRNPWGIDNYCIKATGSTPDRSHLEGGLLFPYCLT